MILKNHTRVYETGATGLEFIANAVHCLTECCEEAHAKAMALPVFMLRNAGTPSGHLASLWARMFNRANAGENNDAVTLLSLAGDEHVLELGFGGGASFPKLFESLPNGKITGVDPVDEMRQRAERKWGAELHRGHLTLARGSAAQIPADDGTFDAALTLNTVYFWEDVDEGARELARVLRPGGKLVVGAAEPFFLQKLGFAKLSYRMESAEYYAEVLGRSGFEDLEVRPVGAHKPMNLIVARRRAHEPA